MPPLDIHLKSSKQRTGKEYEELHRWIDDNKQIIFTFYTLCTVGFFARMSYAMARTPILPLFALSLGAKPEAIGFVVGASTITGIFFKLPAGTLSDIYGRYKMLLISILVFALTPFACIPLTRDFYLLFSF
ncbi:MAG: MFS transporter [Candidatus Brocadiaceae bacterium]|nr:MFS transporter [Candidatus Brocadiaceae bacterium]